MQHNGEMTMTELLLREQAELLYHIEASLEEQAMSIHDFERGKIQAILEQLQAMEPLPAPESLEALGHNVWMLRNEQIKELVQQAEQYALLSVPEEIRDVLEQIWSRKWVLLLPEQKQEDQPHA